MDPSPQSASEPVTLRYRLARALLFLSDAARGLLDLLRWNWRKTWFVWRGRRGQCPCHDRSDSGAALHTHCVPAHEWHHPARFALVCPLLRSTPTGWCCSVTATSVRPFWPRALLVWLSLLLVIHLTGSALAWGVLRGLGQRHLQWNDLAWPGHWHRIPQRQAQRFREDGLAALRRGDYQRAILCLYTSVQLDPQDYATGLLLAQLFAHAGSAGFSDALFDQLLRDHPAQAEKTAFSLHDLLLTSGRHRSLAELCLDRLLTPGSNVLFWERSLYLATELGQCASDLIKDRSTKFARLPDSTRLLLQALALTQRAATSEAIVALSTQLPTPASTVALRQQIEWLATWGAADRARVRLHHIATALDPFTAASLEYFISAARGDQLGARADFRAMLSQPLESWQLDRVCGLLLRFRDSANLRLLPGFLALPPLQHDLGARSALWAVALHYGRLDLARAQAAAAKREFGATWPDISQIDFVARRADQENSLLLLLSTLPFPREVIYALATERARQAQIPTPNTVTPPSPPVKSPPAPRQR